MHKFPMRLVGSFFLLGVTFLFSACAIEAASESSGSSTQSTPSRSSPNVLIIIADDMGADTMSLYALSNDTARTPNLDDLAAAGIVFQNAWATLACSTTRAAVLSKEPKLILGASIFCGVGAVKNHTKSMHMQLTMPTRIQYSIFL